MRTALVVLCKNQQIYAGRIASGILSQTVKPDTVLVVADRPAYGEFDALQEAYSCIEGCRFLAVVGMPRPLGRPRMLHGIPPFCAGYCRDSALEYLDRQYDIAIFTDGDCIPQPQLVESHLAAYVPGGVTVGRRVEMKWQGRDQRQAYSDRPIDIFGEAPRDIDSEVYVADSGVMWTCNVGLTCVAVDALREMNRRLYGFSAVFHPDFCGRWGGEDGFLGMECFYGGIPMRSCPVMEHDGVEHIDHPRPEGYYDHGVFLEFLEAKRRELMCLLGMTGRFRPLLDMVGVRK